MAFGGPTYGGDGSNSVQIKCADMQPGESILSMHAPVRERRARRVSLSNSSNVSNETKHTLLYLIVTFIGLT